MVFGGALVFILLVAPQGLIGTPWWRGIGASRSAQRRRTNAAPLPSGKPAAAGDRP
jgi:hypothetical protein